MSFLKDINYGIDVVQKYEKLYRSSECGEFSSHNSIRNRIHMGSGDMLYVV